jgi:hypothetical protein
MRFWPFLFIVLPTLCDAQSKSILFKRLTHNAGSISESISKVEHTFVFKNGTNNPVLIADVVSSCDCTVAEWPKVKINSGDSGKIKVVFSVMNRPGVFEKGVSVSFEGIDSVFQLAISGYVIPSKSTDVREFNKKTSGLLLKSKTLNMGFVFLNKPVTKSFEYINNSEKDITLEIEPDKRKRNWEATLSPKVLKAKERGIIEITYAATKIEQLGFAKDTLRILNCHTGASKNAGAIAELYITANIVEYFSLEQKMDSINNPKLKLSETSYDFKKIDQDRKYSYELGLWNEGKNNLKIHKIESNCNCISASIDRPKLAQSDTTKVKIVLDTKGRKGTITNFVTFFSNDPLNPIQTLRLKANVASEN